MDLLHGLQKPVVMTAVTTMVEFSSLLTSQMYPVKYFALFTAYGMFSAMVLSLLVILAGFMAFGLP